MAQASAGESPGSILGALLKIVFSLTFPLLIITLCGLGYVLDSVFHLPQFMLWALLAYLALHFATNSIWVAIGLGVFVLGSFPLAWVAFREHDIRVSGVIGEWFGAIVFSGGTAWLTTAWALNGSLWQSFVFAFLLFISWGCAFDATLSTIKLVARRRANRPLPPPIKQQPHGSSQNRTKEPETI